MSRFCAIFLAVVSFMTMSCNKDEEQPLFTMIYEIDYNIPSGLNAFSNHFFTANNINTNIEGFAGEIPLTDVKSIRTIRATVFPVFDNMDYSLLDEAIVDVADSANEDDLLEAAYTIQIPNRRLGELELAPSLVNLQEVMTQPKFNLQFQFRLRTLLTVNQTWRLRFELGAFE